MNNYKNDIVVFLEYMKTFYSPGEKGYTDYPLYTMN